MGQETGTRRLLCHVLQRPQHLGDSALDRWIMLGALRMRHKALAGQDEDSVFFMLLVLCAKKLGLS